MHFVQKPDTQLYLGITNHILDHQIDYQKVVYVLNNRSKLIVISRTWLFYPLNKPDKKDVIGLMLLTRLKQMLEHLSQNSYPVFSCGVLNLVQGTFLHFPKTVTSVRRPKMKRDAGVKCCLFTIFVLCVTRQLLQCSVLKFLQCKSL